LGRFGLGRIQFVPHVAAAFGTDDAVAVFLSSIRHRQFHTLRAPGVMLFDQFHLFVDICFFGVIGFELRHRSDLGQTLQANRGASCYMAWPIGCQADRQLTMHCA